MFHVMTKVYMKHNHIVSHIIMAYQLTSWPLTTFKGQIKYNGQYLLNGACYDQSLHTTQIVSHTYMVFQLTSLSLTLEDLWPWMTFEI